MLLASDSPERLLALEPDELGVLLLTVLHRWPPHDQISLSAFLARNTGYGYQPMQEGQEAARWRGYAPAIRTAVREAWAWLEGQGLLIDANVQTASLIRSLSRRAQKIAQEVDPIRALSARVLPRESLNAIIRDEVWALYQRGRYGTAVFEAMKAVEVAVRVAGGFGPGDLGVDLMRKAFHPANGPLTDLNALTAEREARAALFAGAVGAYKNPLSHRHVELSDPDEAAEIIMLASHLLRIVTERATRDVVSEVVPDGS